MSLLSLEHKIASYCILSTIASTPSTSIDVCNAYWFFSINKLFVQRKPTNGFLFVQQITCKSSQIYCTI